MIDFVIGAHDYRTMMLEQLLLTVMLSLLLAPARVSGTDFLLETKLIFLSSVNDTAEASVIRRVVAHTATSEHRLVRCVAHFVMLRQNPRVARHVKDFLDSFDAANWRDLVYAGSYRKNYEFTESAANDLQTIGTIMVKQVTALASKGNTQAIRHIFTMASYSDGEAGEFTSQQVKDVFAGDLTSAVTVWNTCSPQQRERIMLDVTYYPEDSLPMLRAFKQGLTSKRSEVRNFCRSALDSKAWAASCIDNPEKFLNGPMTHWRSEER